MRMTCRRCGFMDVFRQRIDVRNDRRPRKCNCLGSTGEEVDWNSVLLRLIFLFPSIPLFLPVPVCRFDGTALTLASWRAISLAEDFKCNSEPSGMAVVTTVGTVNRHSYSLQRSLNYGEERTIADHRRLIFMNVELK